MLLHTDSAGLAHWLINTAESAFGRCACGQWHHAISSPMVGCMYTVCCRASFDPICRPSPDGLFTQDPAFWQTVHLGGDGWEEHLAQQAAAAKAAWAGKVVVKDTHFHALPGTGDKAAAQVCMPEWLGKSLSWHSVYMPTGGSLVTSCDGAPSWA